MSDYAELFFAKVLNGNSLEDSPGIPQLCEICENYLSEPILLPCLHFFDKNCIIGLENDLLDYNQIKCPKCDFTAVLSNSQPLNVNLFNAKVDVKHKDEEVDDNDSKCILCTNDEIGVYKCSDCAGIICERCRILHKEVVIFQSHNNIQELTQRDKDNIKDVVKFLGDNKPVKCQIHKETNIDSFCFKCFIGLCSKCRNIDHKNHETVPLEELFENINKDLDSLVSKCKVTKERLNDNVEKLNWSLSEVAKSRNHNKSLIENTYDAWKSAIDKMKDEFFTMNKTYHDNLEYRLMSQINENHKSSDHIDSAIKFINFYLKKCSFLEASKFVKPTLDCLTTLSGLKCDPGPLNTSVLLQCSSPEVIKACVRTNFGSFPNMDSFSNSGHSNIFQENGLFSSSSFNTTNSSLMNMVSSEPNESINMYSPIGANFEDNDLPNNLPKDSPFFQSKLNQLSTGSSRLLSNNSFTGLDSLPHPSNLPISLMHQTSNDFFSYSNEISPLMTSKGSISASTDSGQFMSHALYDDNSLTPPMIPRLGSEFPLDGSQVSLNTQFNNNTFRPLVNMNPVPKPPFPNRNRNYVPMVIKERWGSQGSNRGQLNSPHGFCLGFNEEIVVADTQNHRIHIFSKDGQFISQFGIAGREEGHLWHPRKVTIIRNTQHYVVCDRGSERSRMQIFAKSGYFIRKIAIPYIDIVAGLAINSMGHIVAVDSVSPTIFVVTEMGEMVKWIECSSQMREPSDIVVHGENYYICDFKGHCVCVYKQDGTFLFRFGNEKITNYPNGIDVSNHGDILVGDSHGNRFHVAVFTKDGHLTGEFECPSVKVSRACGLKITSEGYLVTLAKNNHNVLVIDTLYVN